MLKRSGVLLAVCAIVVLTGLSGASQAFAGVPVWWIASHSTPTVLPPGGDGEIIVDVSNLGTADISGSYEVNDRLPRGVTVTSIESTEIGTCEVESIDSIETVKCNGGRAYTPYEQTDMQIKVSVAKEVSSSAVNVADISGGGAKAASSNENVSFGSEPASFGVEKLEQLALNEDGTPDTQAGSHPFEYTTTFQLNEQLKEVEGVNGEMIGVRAPELPKDLHFNLPPGLVGNATAIPQCTFKQFSTFIYAPFVNRCPSNTVVGVVSVQEVFNNGIHFSPLSSALPVFNLAPSVGEPAKFAFDVDGIPIYLDTSVRAGAGNEVVVSVNDINTQLEFTGSQLTLWGTPSDRRHDQSRGWSCIRDGFWEIDFAIAFGGCPASALGGPTGQSFLTLPTSCTGPLRSSVEADSWTHQGAFQKGEYTWHNNSGPLELDGCNRLPFTPSIRVTPDGSAASTPTGLTVDEHVPQDSTLDPEGLAESDVKGLSVALPEGVVLNPSAADGLQGCSEGQIELHSGAAPGCPEASKIATVKVKTPLLPEPLEGAAYLAVQNANPFGSLVALYIYAENPTSGIHVKAAGEVLEDPVTGQLTAHFEHDPSFDGEPVASQFLPQLAFEDIELHFFGGARAPLGTPAHCGAYTTTGTFTPWSESATRESSSTFDITSGPNGGPCPGVSLPFTPSLTAGTTSIQAGGFTPFTMTMSRQDGNQNLQAIQLKMPPGLSGLLSGVKLCDEADADAGTCGSESQIGETIVSVGLGGDPFSVKGGRVYITGPYRGAPFGLSIVNPAVAGPFNLGNVVVRGKIEVDPATAKLTITSDNSGPYAIPHILDGIPLQIQHVNVTINRPGFTFNPSNCSPLTIKGLITSVEGGSEDLSVPFQATNCATLRFAPRLAASTSGKTSRASGASLSVKLIYPKASFGSEANISRVKVDLPRQLPSRLTTLQKACTAAQFESNPAGCPAASIVGHAKAITPLVPVPLEGPAYFVSHGGEAFPSLILVLQGYGVKIDLVGTTFINKAGITSSTFKAVPDAPVDSFELNLPEGKFSALAANGNLCKTKLVMPTEFVAQNGLAIHKSTSIGVDGCAKNRELTRTQKLTAALRACRRGSGKAKAKRVGCEKQARKRYAAARKKK